MFDRKVLDALVNKQIKTVKIDKFYVVCNKIELDGEFGNETVRFLCNGNMTGMMSVDNIENLDITDGHVCIKTLR